MNTKEIKYLLLIVVIFIASCIETDIYLPAFADMMLFFSASETEIQSLLSWNFFGICISGPIYGPISDAVGRKKPLIVALGLFLIGSIMTIMAQGFDLMLWGRLLQGLGSGGCFTLGTAVLFDAFRAEKAMQAMNRINFIIPFLMAAAPLLGGYLNTLYGFRSNFLAIALFVVVSFFLCLFLFDETLAHEKRAPLQIRKVFRDFRRALVCPPFVLSTLAMCLHFTGYLAFLSGTAVLFVVDFGMDKQLFPLYQAALLVAWLFGTLSFNRVMMRFGVSKTKRLGALFILVGGIGCGLSAFFAPQNATLVTVAMMLYAFGGNWVVGTYFPESMEILPDIKGVTASLVTSARLLITAVVVGIVSSYYNATIVPLAITVVIITVAVLAMLAAYERIYRRKEEAVPSSHFVG